MRLLRLQLFDYRNFHRVDLALAPGPSLFLGDNAQGKTNLLAAVYLLATTRDPRAESEAQLIRHESLEDITPAARVVGDLERAAGPLKVEIAVLGRPGPDRVGLLASKVARVNGVPRRLSDAIGHLVAVLFTAEDIELIGGPPSLRRRYLDITLSQVDRLYLAARQRLERLLLQRNHLLKRIREGAARGDELSFWDEELAKDGGYIFHRRAEALTSLEALATESHAGLAPSEELRLAYQPRLDASPSHIGQSGPAPMPALGSPARGGPGVERWQMLSRSGPAAAAQAYAAALRRGLGRDIAAGMTLQGPHRDDLAVFLDGVPAGGYASRAQQRTIALALRLAEARFLLSHRRDSPVLLLDDVLSEMDAARRLSVIQRLADYEQILITATDADRFPPDFLSRAALFSVAAGNVEPLAQPAAIPKAGEA